MLFWDTADPYDYRRLDRHRDHEIAAFGGEDHKTGQASETHARYERLEHAIASRIPTIELTHRWSGQVIDRSYGLPYIWYMTDHQDAATGLWWQRHDVRDPCRDHDRGRYQWTSQSLGRAV